MTPPSQEGLHSRLRTLYDEPSGRGFPLVSSQSVDDPPGPIHRTLELTVPAGCSATNSEERNAALADMAGGRRAYDASWCPNRDLLAVLVATDQGTQVQMRRLNGTKVWTIDFRFSGSPPLADDHKIRHQVTSIGWRPDSRILALASSAGHICLVDVETAALVSTVLLGEFPRLGQTPKVLSLGTVTQMTWGQRSDRDAKQSYPDGASTFERLLASLPRPHIPSSVSHTEPASRSASGSIGTTEEVDGALSVLCILTSTGLLGINAYGRFPVCLMDVAAVLDHPEKDIQFRTVTCAPDLTHITLGGISTTVGAHSTNQLSLATLDLGLLVDAAATVRFIASRSACTQQAIQLGQLLHSIHEDCRSTLQTLPKEWLATYARTLTKHDESLDPRTELLTLLATGTAGPGTTAFLLSDLKSRGARKWIKAMEQAYLELRKRLAISVKPLVERLVVQLSELLGQSRLGPTLIRPGGGGSGCGGSVEVQNALTLDTRGIERCIVWLGWLMGRLEELQQFVSAEWIRAHAFGEWLAAVIEYTVALQSTEEQSEEDRIRLPRFHAPYLLEFISRSLFNDQRETVLEAWFAAGQSADAGGSCGEYLAKLVRRSPGLEASSPPTTDASVFAFPFVFAEPRLPYVRGHDLYPESTQILRGDELTVPGTCTVVECLTKELTELFARPARAVAASLHFKCQVDLRFPTVDKSSSTSADKPGETTIAPTNQRPPRSLLRSFVVRDGADTLHSHVLARPSPISATADSPAHDELLMFWTRFGPRSTSTPAYEPTVTASRVPLTSLVLAPTDAAQGGTVGTKTAVQWQLYDLTHYRSDSLIALAQGRCSDRPCKLRPALLHLSTDLGHLNNIVDVTLERREPKSDDGGAPPPVTSWTGTPRLDSTCSGPSELPLLRSSLPLKRTLLLGSLHTNGREQREVAAVISRTGQRINVYEVGDVETSDTSDEEKEDE